MAIEREIREKFEVPDHIYFYSTEWAPNRRNNIRWYDPISVDSIEMRVIEGGKHIPIWKVANGMLYQTHALFQI